MNIPINLRVLGQTPRIPGGADYVTIQGEALTGGTIFGFKIQRAALAEMLALYAPHGRSEAATLTEMEGVEDTEPVLEPEPPVEEALRIIV